MFLQDDLSHWYGGSWKLLTPEIEKQWRGGREERQEQGRGQDEKKKGRMWKERQASKLSLRSWRLSLRPPRSKGFPYTCFSGACLSFLATPSSKNEAGLHVRTGFSARSDTIVCISHRRKRIKSDELCYKRERRTGCFQGTERSYNSNALL